MRSDAMAARALGDVQRVLRRGLRQDDRELVAAVARGQVGCPARRAQHLGDRAQDGVPRLVPVRVVDLAKIVDVDHDEREHARGTLGTHHLVLQAQVKGAVIEEPRESILRGLGAHVLVCQHVAPRARRRRAQNRQGVPGHGLDVRGNTGEQDQGVGARLRLDRQHHHARPWDGEEVAHPVPRGAHMTPLVRVRARCRRGDRDMRRAARVGVARDDGNPLEAGRVVWIQHVDRRRLRLGHRAGRRRDLPHQLGGVPSLDLHLFSDGQHVTQAVRAPVGRGDGPEGEVQSDDRDDEERDQSGPQAPRHRDQDADRTRGELGQQCRRIGAGPERPDGHARGDGAYTEVEADVERVIEAQQQDGRREQGRDLPRSEGAGAADRARKDGAVDADDQHRVRDVERALEEGEIAVAQRRGARGHQRDDNRRWWREEQDGRNVSGGDDGLGQAGGDTHFRELTGVRHQAEDRRLRQEGPGCEMRGRARHLDRDHGDSRRVDGPQIGPERNR